MDRCCKVGSTTATYDLRGPSGSEGVDDYLAARWVGVGEYDPTGYRTLADWFNRRVLRTVYLDHGRSATEVRVESEYRALTGDDDLRRREVLDDLATDGVDAEALLDALVSRSTMARHLKGCLDAEKSSAEAGSDWEREKIAYGRRTFRRSVDEAVTSLAGKGVLPGGDRAEVELPVRLSCPECATRVSLDAALRRGSVCEEHLGARTPDDGGRDSDTS